MPDITEAEKELWLQRNTFWCHRLKCRLTYSQCRHNRSLPLLTVHAFPLSIRRVYAWKGQEVPVKPYPCEGCPGCEKPHQESLF